MVAMDNRSINEVPLSVPMIVQVVSCFSCRQSLLLIMLKTLYVRIPFIKGPSSMFRFRICDHT